MNQYNPFSIDDKTILVTGASSGIGKATAIECSKMGAHMIITGRNEERLMETYSLLEGSGHKTILCDLEESDSIEHLSDEIPEVQGLVNNAGFTSIVPVQFIDEKSLQSILKVNTIAPILLLQKLLQKKKLKKNSSVVFTSSIAGIGCVTKGNDMYAASKGAISSFIKNAALDLSSKKIRVNAVCPGMVNTNILSDGTITQEQISQELNNFPLGRFGEPQDIAWAIIYLLSDASCWVTGTNLTIDGGYTIK